MGRASPAVVTAWAATTHENDAGRLDEPAPVIVRPAITVGRHPPPGTTAAVLGAAAALGAIVAAIRRLTVR